MIYKGHSLDSFSATPAHIVHSSQGSQPARRRERVARGAMGAGLVRVCVWWRVGGSRGRSEIKNANLASPTDICLLCLFALFLFAGPTGNARLTSTTATSASTVAWRNASAWECAKKVRTHPHPHLPSPQAAECEAGWRQERLWSLAAFLLALSRTDIDISPISAKEPI